MREASELSHSPMYKMKKAAGMTTCHSRYFPHFSRMILWYSITNFFSITMFS